jgi:hypothetical protein
LTNYGLGPCSTEMRGWTDPASVAAALWCTAVHRRWKRELREMSPLDICVSAPPALLPDRAFRGVRYILDRSNAMCLERCLVQQAWLSRRGVLVDVVVGVSTTGGFTAHAWLDGHEPHSAEQYSEMLRLPVGSGAAQAG